MKLTVVGRQMKVYDETKELIAEKLSTLDKFFPEEGSATVTLKSKRNQKILEITLVAANTLFRSEVGADSFRDALDRAIDILERQIRKNKTRLAKRLRTGAIVFPKDWDTPDEPMEILRTKTFPTKPMSPEEAILEMNLSGHRFFVFNNDQNGHTCVVYARDDGGYGMIVPES